MRMKQETYESLKSDFQAVIAKLEETGARLHPKRDFDADNLTMQDMWDILLVVNTDRSHDSHPRWDYPGMLPRVLENDGRSSHWLWDRDGEDLDDSHIETAFRKMMKEFAEERAAQPARTFG